TPSWRAQGGHRRTPTARGTASRRAAAEGAAAGRGPLRQGGGLCPPARNAGVEVVRDPLRRSAECDGRAVGQGLLLPDRLSARRHGGAVLPRAGGRGAAADRAAALPLYDAVAAVRAERGAWVVRLRAGGPLQTAAALRRVAAAAGGVAVGAERRAGGRGVAARRHDAQGAHARGP